MDSTEIIQAVAEPVKLPKSAEFYIVLARYSSGFDWQAIYNDAQGSYGVIFRDEKSALETTQRNASNYHEFKLVRVTLPIR